MAMILDISCDYPDAVVARKTRAVAALVEGSADHFDHRVYSLNRVSPSLGGGRMLPGAVGRIADDGIVASWTYAAPGQGMLLGTAMRRVADAILEDVARRDLKPALVHGHKLSFEGLAAVRVAHALGVPLALSLQGNTDQRVLRVRRDLWRRYRRVYHTASIVFAFSPWIVRWLDARLGPRTDPPRILPCVPVSDRVIAPVIAPPVVASAFHLDHYRLKNAARLIAATGGAARQVPGLSLDLAGAGAEDSERAIDAMIARDAPGIARRIGAIAPDRIQPWMNGAALFAMPSNRETFGMVFVEAVLAGCPIVYPAGRAVDGYFDGRSFATAVDPGDTDAIADAIVAMSRRQEAAKAELAEWQRSPAAGAFRRDAILSAYTSGLAQAIGGAA